LRAHGHWWHHGNQNRWVALVDGEIAAYCGIIPTQCLINGGRESGFWWVDLVVAPEFRGRGVQRFLDTEIDRMGELKLGFPNSLAARIHRKHGWGVRGDMRVLMFPLRPLRVKKVRTGSGFPGSMLRGSACLATPFAALMRRHTMRYEPLTARIVEAPSPDLLAGIFERHKEKGTATTYRDGDYVRSRYFDAPYRAELSFFIAGPASLPTHFVVARNLTINGVKTTRLLDVFGDFADLEGLEDVLKLAVEDGARQGSSQITTLASIPELRAVLRSMGFLIGTKTRFCWRSNSQNVMRSLGLRGHWVLGDSDNDAPE